MTRTNLLLAALCLAFSGAAFAQAKPARAKQPTPPVAKTAPDCARAAYHGDPVCFGADDAGDLPTPSAGAIPRQKSEDVRINDDISVTGADPKAMKKTPVDQYLNNPNPNPHRQDVGGGAAVNYKF